MALGEDQRSGWRSGLAGPVPAAGAPLPEDGARLRRVLAGAPVILSVIDPEGICVLSEGRGLEALRLAPGVGVGRSVFEFYAGHADVVANVRRALAGEAFSATVRVGETVFESHYAPVFGEDGRVTSVTVVSTNVTEREQALARLRESELRLRTLVENAWDVIAVLGGSGRFGYVSPNVAEVAGWTPAELLGRSILPLLHREDLPRAQQAFARALAGEKSSPSLFRVRGRSGEWQWYDSTLCRHDSDGRTWVVAISRDVSERVRAEEALRESEARHRALAENAHDLICEIDEAGRLVYASPNYEAVLGYRYDELIGGRGFDLVHPEDRASVRRRFDRAFESGVPVQAVFRFRHASGEWRWFESSGNSFRTARGEVHGVVISRDITERKRTEEALLRSHEQLQKAQRMEAVGRLAGGVAHDFNNMLLLVLGHADAVLGRLPGDDPLRDDMIEIRDAAQRAADVTRQLLAFGRRQVLQPRVLDLNAVVNGVRRMLRRSVRANVEVVAELAPGLGAVRADPAQIEQVVVNLVLNASDAMPTGGRLTIRTANVDDEPGEDGGPPQSWVELAVSDTGVGMDEETLQRIFEPFFTTKETGKGTGLGLATVYGTVHQSGGVVRVESAPGRGATFRVRLPRVDERPERLAPHVPAAARGGAERVLLVEDEPRVRRHLQRTLQAAGYSVQIAADAEEAMALADAGGELVDLLVTDVVMPGMSGMALAERLRAQRPALRVLYVSGYVEDVVTPKGVLVPGAAFLEKPFTPEVLVAKVREVLDAPPEPSQG